MGPFTDNAFWRDPDNWHDPDVEAQGNPSIPYHAASRRRMMEDELRRRAGLAINTAQERSEVFDANAIRDEVDQWTGEVWPNMDAEDVYNWLIRGEQVG